MFSKVLVSNLIEMLKDFLTHPTTASAISESPSFKSH
nr:unnamed protein product [Callosobruchus analis]